jgi:hypothetical protein
MRERSKQPDARHTAYLDQLKAALGDSGKDLPAEELLAVTSQFVGMLIAQQDQRRFTPDMVMAIVGRNIEIGNASAIESSGLTRPGGAA